MNRESLIKKIFSKEKFLVGIFYVALVVAWQLLYWLGTVQFGWWKSYAFPSPLGVVESCKSLIEKGTLLQAFLYSIVRGAVGFGLSVVLGLMMGRHFLVFVGFRLLYCGSGWMRVRFCL